MGCVVLNLYDEYNIFIELLYFYCAGVGINVVIDLLHSEFI